MAMPIKTDDVWLLGRAWSTPAGLRRGASVVFRTVGEVARGRKPAGIGAALTASFLEAVVINGGADLWLSTPLEEILIEKEAAVGVRTTKDGRPFTIGARRGVMLAGGGFDHNKAWRRTYHGIDGDPSGAPGNLGRPIELAVEVGAATELLDDAWWGASTAPTSATGPSFLVGERSFPHSIMVDARGDRFANESESYVDLGHHMLAHDQGGAYWMIADRRHARRYLRSYALDPKGSKAMKAEGVSLSDDTLAGLATTIGIDPARLQATVERFNGFARAGVDGDFGRGNSAYDRYYGDPLVHPNPNLGALEKGPFTAIKIVVGDLGTKGGVLTDPEARALREDGTVIEGLYSAGNNSASVMGRTYPGPGSTLGPAVVFGMRAARHMARNKQGTN
jgi:3-oxosteroid 1-dehydrogenase